MSARFNHLFVLLMTVSFIAALVLPSGSGAMLRNNVRFAWWPVTRPLQAGANWVRYRFGHPAEDPKQATSSPDLAQKKEADLRLEVEAMRATVSQLTSQVNYLTEVNNSLKGLGDAGKYCRTFDAVSTDSSRTRESLGLKAGSLDGVSEGMAVLTQDNLVGRILSVSVGGSQVQLITDPQLFVRVAFRRYEHDPKEGSAQFRIIKIDRQATCQGAGNGTAVINNLYLKDIQSLKEGDYVVLDDPEWKREIQGIPLGRIEKIGAQRRAPGFAEIRIRPRVNPTQLTSAMVLVKK